MGEMRGLQYCTLVFKNCVDHRSPWELGFQGLDSQAPQAPHLGAAGELINRIGMNGPFQVVGLENFVPPEHHLSYLQAICSQVASKIESEMSYEDGIPTIENWLKFRTHDRFREFMEDYVYNLTTVG